MFLAHRRAAILQHFNIATLLTQLRLEGVQTPRHIDQTLIADHAFNGAEPGIDIVKLDLHRVFGRIGGTGRQQQHGQDSKELSFHDTQFR